jgi:hypothetical protein
MKTKIINDLVRYAIPDGEGFNALPISFIPHHYISLPGWGEETVERTGGNK